MTHEQETTRAEFIESLGLTNEAIFIPHSKSRNKKGTPCLNWEVTISKGKQSIMVEYMKGIAHIPGYKQQWRKKTLEDQEREASYKKTCETGKTYTYLVNIDWNVPKNTIPSPTLEEILYCLVMESDVLNYGTYEEWASDLDYDEDSRKGERIYRLCLEQSLKLKNMIGELAIEQLRELFQDY